MQHRLVVIALALVSSPSVAAECVAELSGLVDELAARHYQEAFRRSAAAAHGSVEGICAEAADVPDAAARLLSGLGDPAVRVMRPAHFERTLAEWTGTPVAGIGLTELLSIDIDEQTGLLTVIAPVPGSPAAEEGLETGDVVATIDGVATAPLGLTRSMESLRIAQGEQVELGILRGDRIHPVTLRAERLPALDPVTTQALRLAGRRVLQVELRQFVPGASEQLRAAVEEATGVDAIVLDLRDNPGGLVDELLQSAGVFLAPGTSIASISGPQAGSLAVADNAVPVGTPLYVIIGPGTASAAEGLAGALQDHGRARLFGSRTFGKGLVHQTLPMSDGSVLMFPTGQLQTPKGRPVLRRGIDPDVRTSNPLTLIEADLDSR